MKPSVTRRLPSQCRVTSNAGEAVPLINSASKAAFQKNVATEVKAGAPTKQALAIAYAKQREARKRKGASQ